MSKRLLNDGNCETNDENVDNQLTKPAAKRQVTIKTIFLDETSQCQQKKIICFSLQKLNANSKASTSKKSGKHKPTLRKQEQRPRYVISSDSSSNNDSVSINIFHQPIKHQSYR